MFTTCPKCSLKLVVTAADLRVAQGYVRCGRCSNVFNALAGLSDGDQAALARGENAAAREPTDRETAGREAAAREAADRGAAASSPAPPAPRRDEQPSPAPSSGASISATRAEEPIPDIALEFNASATDVTEVFVEPTADDDPTGTFESIVLQGEDAPLDEPSALRRETSAPQAAAGAPSASEWSMSPSRALQNESETHELELDLERLVSEADARAGSSTNVAASVGERAAAAPLPMPEPQQPATPGARQAPAPDALQAPAPESLRARAPPHSVQAPASERLAQPQSQNDERTLRLKERALGIGSAVLALTLIVQIIHHERAELAEIGWLRGPLTTMYAELGMPLVPHWDVSAYEVRQLGAGTEPDRPGVLIVRASVKNTAPRKQPLPLLRVTMQDRFGNRIAARDVPPSAYLSASSASRADLGAGQRVDAEVAFVDPGPNAVGFEIDACLALASGRIACANDTGANDTNASAAQR